MNTFVDAVLNQEARTENGMKARASTTNACVDLFFKAGASRGKNILPQFTAAYVENKDVALRIAQWLRDIRGGAGERQLFRDILIHLEKHDQDAARALLRKTPELGRWDDIFVFQTHEMKREAYTMLGDALHKKNGLAAKWTPRQGPLAIEIRQFLNVSPKYYRKTLVELTKVVESQMCAKDWDNINFSHVPSLAHSRYKKAFSRNTEKYKEYVEALVKNHPSVKVNASAVYPYDVLKGMIHYQYDSVELDLITKQWEALPNYIGDANILPLVDVSGSMTVGAGNSPISCLEIAVSLGLYLADKNVGKFKDTFLTFSSDPELITLRGNIVQKITQMNRSKWQMNTNLIKALDKILLVAANGNVPQSEMPDVLLILSDMQFDQCASFNDSAYQAVVRRFTNAGYKIPGIVFWNLNARDNVPVKFNKFGVALVSGFSPSILKAVLSAEMKTMTPEAIMLKTVMVPRYDY